MTIRVKFRVDGDVVETMLIENRDIGPQIRQHNACGLEAGDSAVLDVHTKHCDACESSVAEQIGLSDDEIAKIKQWRTRKADGISSGELGKILDKIVDCLDDEAYETCKREHGRIVVEVEPTP